MWIDKGHEFYNKDVRKLIELYSKENEEKDCVIERFSRTIKLLRDHTSQRKNAHSLL